MEGGRMLRVRNGKPILTGPCWLCGRSEFPPPPPPLYHEGHLCCRRTVPRKAGVTDDLDVADSDTAMSAQCEVPGELSIRSPCVLRYSSQPLSVELEEAKMQACAEGHENDEEGSLFGALGSVDSSLNLSWESCPTRSPFALLEATTEPRPSDQQLEVLERSETPSADYQPVLQPPAEPSSSLRSQSWPAEQALQELYIAPGSKTRERNKRAQHNFRQRQKVTQSDLIASAQKPRHLVLQQCTSHCVIQAKSQQQEQDLSIAHNQIDQLREHVGLLKYLLAADNNPIHTKVQTLDVAGISNLMSASALWFGNHASIYEGICCYSNLCVCTCVHACLPACLPACPLHARFCLDTHIGAQMPCFRPIKVYRDNGAVCFSADGRPGRGNHVL